MAKCKITDDGVVVPLGKPKKVSDKKVSSNNPTYSQPGTYARSIVTNSMHGLVSGVAGCPELQ
jgi:hypothetical protein